MDEPRKPPPFTDLLRGMLSGALRGAERELRQAAWRVIVSLAMAMAVAVLLFVAAVAMAVVGVLHVAQGLRGLIAIPFGGPGWPADLITGGLLIALPAVALLVVVHWRLRSERPTA